MRVFIRMDSQEDFTHQPIPNTVAFKDAFSRFVKFKLPLKVRLGKYLLKVEILLSPDQSICSLVDVLASPEND